MKSQTDNSIHIAGSSWKDDYFLTSVLLLRAHTNVNKMGLAAGSIDPKQRGGNKRKTQKRCGGGGDGGS